MYHFFSSWSSRLLEWWFENSILANIYLLTKYSSSKSQLQINNYTYKNGISSQLGIYAVSLVNFSLVAEIVVYFSHMQAVGIWVQVNAKFNMLIFKVGWLVRSSSWKIGNIIFLLTSLFKFYLVESDLFWLVYAVFGA